MSQNQIPIQLNTIEAGIKEIKKGKILIVVDDENRENEGDFIAAAEFVTPEMINFMATHGRGLICAPLTEERCEELELGLMTAERNNNAPYQTPFTISVDLIGSGCTTGISASDRSKTIQALINPRSKPSDFCKPGHIFPLKAKKGGVLRRCGHTEAAIDLNKLAELNPAGVIVEIMNEDGTMARLPNLMKIAKKFDLKIISIKDLIAYRMQREMLVERLVSVNMPTEVGNFNLIAFKQITNNNEHVALVKGDIENGKPVLLRVHSSCMTGDIFGSCRCDCGEQLKKAMELIEKEGRGAIIYMNQEGRGIGLINKLKAYKLQEQGRDTVEANIELGFKADERDYGIGAQIIKNLNISKIRLMSNNPRKRIGLLGFGIEITEVVPIRIPHNSHNENYLKTKRDKLGHSLNFKD